jgi:uncharacterized membrane protein YobD (UPF0266 family)
MLIITAIVLYISKYFSYLFYDLFMSVSITEKHWTLVSIRKRKKIGAMCIVIVVVIDTFN